MAAQIFRLAVNGVGLIALTRMLPPTDHGLVALVLSITGFFVIFRDSGLPEATIVNAEMSEQELSNIYWINLGLGLSVAGCIVVLSPFVSRFYGDPRLMWITAALAAPFVMAAAASQHVAVMKRKLRFKELAVMDVSAVTLANMVGIGAALLGLGYWALVLVQIVGAGATSIGAWLLSGWRPRGHSLGTPVRRFVKFGAHITAFDVVNYFSRNADNLLIGKVFGAAALGVYAKAYQLFMLPLAQIKGPAAAVALPTMSKLRGEPVRYRAYYLRLIETLAFTTMPVSAGIFVCAEPVVRLLLGETWLGVVPILKVLAVAGLVQSVETTRGIVMLSSGRSDKYLRYGAARAVYSVASFVLGLRWGPLGVAAVYVAAGYVALVPSLVYCFAGTPIRAADFLRTIVRPLLCTIVALVGTTALLSWLSLPPAGAVAVGVASVSLLYVSGMASTAGGRTTIMRMYEYIAILVMPLRRTRLIMAIQSRLNPRRLARRLGSWFHRMRLGISRPHISGDITTEVVYSQAQDPDLLEWTVQDERWSRVIHRSQHRREVRKGRPVVVQDDVPEYRHPDLDIRADELWIEGRGETCDEWVYMFLHPARHQWRNFSWRFEFLVQEPFREIQFGFRYLDFYNRYRFRIEGGFLHFDVVERGEFTNDLGRVRFAPVLERWYRFEIKGLDSVFELLVDGRVVLAVKDHRDRFEHGS